MTKKLIVIILSVILCLAVVGGCFALYHKDAEQLEITFGSEQAVTLTTSIGGDTGKLNFNGVKLSPTQDRATQEITLNVNTPNPETLAGLSGQLTVKIDGALKDAILLKASYVDGAEPKTLNASNYVISLTLPLDQLPEVLTLTATLVDTDDATFAQNSNKSATISVTWKAIDWAPVEGGYYIVGTHSAWGINKDAILLDGTPASKPTPEQVDKAVLLGVSLKKGEEFKIRQYVNGQASSEGWLQLGVKSGTESEPNIPADGSIIVEGNKVDGNISVAEDGLYDVYVNYNGVVWIAKSTPQA